MGIYWNKDAKTEGEESRAPAKPKVAARPRPGPPVSGTRAWTSTHASDEVDQVDQVDRNDGPDKREKPATGPAVAKGAREPGSGKP